MAWLLALRQLGKAALHAVYCIYDVFYRVQLVKSARVYYTHIFQVNDADIFYYYSSKLDFLTRLRQSRNWQQITLYNFHEIQNHSQ